MLKPPATIIHYPLICGIICGCIAQIKPLLADINHLTEYDFLDTVSLCLLANGASASDIADCVADTCPDIAAENIHILTHQQVQILTISKARTMLQRAIGQMMLADKTAIAPIIAPIIAWLLDDDMRIPAIAQTYLTWLPIMQQKGVDVVIGSITGASPNPPAHGMAVQINDLWHNLQWLETLDNTAILPDRSHENAEFRKQYPDYYYDLSRKHSGHLSKAYWLTPNHHGETVGQARETMLNNLTKIFTGEPFLRPLISDATSDTMNDDKVENPLDAMQPSCNRGGNCFILNGRTLTDTPNIVTQHNGVENRRSDMIWALINRYHHGFNIVAVDFPITHHRFMGNSINYNIGKHIAEINGAALYASLCDFFNHNPDANFDFTDDDCTHIITVYQDYITKRLTLYRQNYQKIDRILQQLCADFQDKYPQILPFVTQSKNWINEKNLQAIDGVSLANEAELKNFLMNCGEAIRLSPCLRRG